MTRRQRLISLMILSALTMISVMMSDYVLQKAEPEKLEAFRNRFWDQRQLCWMIGKGAGKIDGVDEKYARFSWERIEEEIIYETALIPMEDCRRLRVNATIAGPQNAFATGRWNQLIWMELFTQKDGELVSSEKIEICLESNKDRGRVYAIECNASGANQYQVRLLVQPVNGIVEEGWLDVSKWEVYTR